MRDNAKVYRWTEMPQQVLWDGQLSRTALRGDGAIVTFNWIAPGTARVEPHQHPFDQIVLIVSGQISLEVDGEVFEMGPGTALRVPSGVPHTMWTVGDETVLNIDVFAPARSDYLFLANHQASDFTDGRYSSTGVETIAQGVNTLRS